MKIKLLFIAIISVSLLQCKSEQSEPLPRYGLLWKISGHGLTKTSYLFGTYHDIGGMRILDSIKTFDSIFSSTNLLVCEFQLSGLSKLLEPRNSNKSNTQKSLLKPWPVADSTYDNLLTAKQKYILDSCVNSNDILKLLKKANLNMRPIQLQGFIKFTFKDSLKKIEDRDFLQKNGLINEIMLDINLQDLAKGRNMKIVALDSIDKYQKIKDSIESLIYQISYKKEVDILMQYIENHYKIDSLEQDLKEKHLSAYLKQDINYFMNWNTQQLKELKVINSEHLSLPGIKNYLEEWNTLIIDDRNNHWMKRIPNLLEKSSCFIAVGAGHLIGEKGLINQLRKLNYTVVPINEISKQN